MKNILKIFINPYYQLKHIAVSHGVSVVEEFTK